MIDNAQAYLRNPLFDMTLILGVAVLALVSGGIVVWKPGLFEMVLLLDLWFLGYHHVVATFTRLSFDLHSFRENKFFVLWLPVIVIVAVIGVALAIGPWIIATTYFYWQWFHYTRQSYGIACVYKRKANPDSPRVNKYVMYLLPALGILYRSYQNPGYFLGMELKCLYVPLIVIQVLSYITAAVLLVWVVKQFAILRNNRQHFPYFLYMLSHLVIFSVGYLVIEDINMGWLVLNVWHNAQYIMFVWLFNNKKFKSGVIEKQRWISWLSQDSHQLQYYATCLAISTFFYFTTSKLLAMVTFSALPIVIIFYQAINFHHYIVDGLIWKVRSKPIQKTLELS